MSKKNVFKKIANISVDTVKVVNAKLKTLANSLDAGKDESIKNIKDKAEDKHENLHSFLESSEQTFEEMIIDKTNVKRNMEEDGTKKLSIAQKYLKNTIEDTEREAKKLGWLETMKKVNMQDGKYNSIFGKPTKDDKNNGL